MQQPSIAIIIVNYNGGRFLRALADSLAALSYRECSLFLVDNASTDGSGAMLGDLFPGGEVLLNRTNVGLAAAINQVLAALPAGPRYVLLLNPDTMPAPDFLERLVSAAGDDRTLVVPRVMTPAGRLAGHAGGFDLRRGLLIATHDEEPADSAAALRQREVETGSFSCMLIPRSAFEAIGMLDESLGMYYEDTDFCLRARRAGFRIFFQPDAVVVHDEGGSSGGRESPFAIYYTTRNRPRLVRRHAKVPAFLCFLGYFALTRLARGLGYCRAGRWRDLRALLLGLLDYARGRRGLTCTPGDL